MKFYLLTLYFVIYAVTPIIAQKNTDEQLAMQYYERKEFDKAVVYFEKLYDKTPDAFFNQYQKCLLEIKEYAKAEKVIKKQIKRNNTATQLYVTLGKVYQLQGNEDKEKEQYQKAIKELIPDQSYVFTLAHAFEDTELYDYAIEAYLKGRKAQKDIYPYYYELAEVYKKKNDLKSMINEYLDAIDFRESELYTAQANLQQSLGYDEKNGGFNNPLLKQELQKRILKNPDKTVFSEFLIFIQNQQKDFEGSFTQTKALDKRKKEDGTRLMDLAKLCVSNNNYDVAERCYQYVISKGIANPYYDVATIERLNSNYLKQTNQATLNKVEIALLSTDMEVAITHYGITNLTLPIIRKNAQLKAYFLDKPTEAIQNLEEVMTQYTFDKTIVAEMKLELGDMEVLQGNIWDASLLYSQVEKDPNFKYEIIGQEAKFKNAKLSYYASDFKWAKAQCDILKGATSKTIANDALDLSLIITDAIGIDTNEVPLSMFSSAELLIQQHQYDKAIARLDSINLEFSNHTLGDDIYYKKADIYKRSGNYSEALKMYENITQYYPDELYGDDALFKQAELQDQFLLNKEKAQALYEEILTKYPGSIYVVEARKHYRALRGDVVN